MTREIKTINGKQYAYEVSRYIRKIVDGKPTRIREIVAVKGIYVNAGQDLCKIAGIKVIHPI